MTRSFAHKIPSRRRQAGAVLFVALIVMVALSLAGIALFRSMETSLSVVGNLAFGQAAIAPMNRAVEEVVLALFEAKTINPNADNAGLNYYATIQAGETPRGIPALLQPGVSALTFTGSPTRFTDAADNRVSWVVERMCSVPIVLPAVPKGSELAVCELARKAPTGTKIEMDFDTPPDPFYRLTVRVDGPANTVSYAQAMLR